MLIKIIPPVFGIVLLFAGCTMQKSDNHVESVLNEIFSIHTALKGNSGGKVGSGKEFVTVWDFDGTVIKGDCSEGYTRNGKVVYAGLAEAGIDAGMSGIYRPGEFRRFWSDYQSLDRKKGHHESYPFLARIFSGSRESDLLELAQFNFNERLKDYYFYSSMRIIDELKNKGIGIMVISASPEFFVKGAADSMNLSADSFRGIRLVTEKGLLLDRVVDPVTFAEGKVAALSEMVDDLRKKTGREVVVLAGFGNSFKTDGPFLKQIAGLRYGDRKAVSVMINGGTAPEAYRGLFREVRQITTVSGKQ